MKFRNKFINIVCKKLINSVTLMQFNYCYVAVVALEATIVAVVSAVLKKKKRKKKRTSIKYIIICIY